MKKQVVVIHGADAFETYEKYIDFLKSFEIDSLDYFKGGGWKKGLQEKLGDGFEVIAPRMPNEVNAKYLEWKIWFDKLVPLLNPEIIFVGHSMGGIFLAKYLSENDFPKKVLGVFLVAAPYDETDGRESLGDFILSSGIANLAKYRVFLYHSEDDPVVPFVDLSKYEKQLPTAIVRVFKDREHFGIEEFPELVRDIQNLL